MQHYNTAVGRELKRINKSQARLEKAMRYAKRSRYSDIHRWVAGKVIPSEFVARKLQAAILILGGKRLSIKSIRAGVLPLKPNKETIAAIKAARRGELITVGSTENLIADLNKRAKR